MTKLKGTIQLGEGYNKTKAVFNGNIDNLEVKSISIKDSTARDILLGNGTTLPLFNGSNTINSQYLPSYVDDVIEAPSQNDFPVMGESGKIYLDLSTNSTYRWSGSTYVLVTSGDMETTINDIVNQIQEVESNVTAIQNILDSDKFKEYNTEYLTFTALEDSTVGFENPSFDLFYSFDCKEWNLYNEIVNLPKDAKIYFKADTTTIESEIGTFIVTGKVDVSGNVMSIVYADDFIGKVYFPNDKMTMKSLFGGNQGLHNAHNLILPATTLTEGCYNEMFYYCESLTTAPELPATTLTDGCYNGMFRYCTSLVKAPELPAMTLANYCYSGMFCDCTSLTTAPELPATTLVNNCYEWMFSGCINLNYIKMLATDISNPSCLGGWVAGVASTGTFVKNALMDSLPAGWEGIPEGWTVEDYISPEQQLKELQVSVDTNTEEIDILKNRIISTTYSELKDAVTNSTLTIGQYYRITDYVTTCNGTSAKVTDASTIDPENPVDGQSRSAGHQFDIIVRALSPNQLDENAVAVCNASETYYDSTFNGTVVKYSIENKYWSTEDGKGTIYYMKDHNDNECSYDFTNIEYYYAESTTWYLTFNKDSSKVVILNTNTVLPFVIIYGHLESPNSISITGSLQEIYMYAGAINAVDIKGTINSFKVIAPNNVRVHTINITGMYETVLLHAQGLISTIIFNGYFQNVAIESGGDLAFFTIYGQHQNFIIKSAPEKNCLRFFIQGQSLNSSIDASEIPAVPSDFTCFGYLYETTIKAVVSRVTICGTLQNSTIEAKGMSKLVFQGTNKNLVINTNNNNITSSSWKSNSNITIQGSTHALSFLDFGDSVQGIKILSYEGLTPSYITFNNRVYNITIEGGVQNVTLTNVACNLHLKSTQETAFAADITINGVRGVSADSLLEIPLYSVKGGCKKDIYRDVSGHIFYTWEDNLVKKGYYINDNTDTEWKEIPTPEEPVEVPTIPDAVTTALSVATLDLTTRTTIATIATDETLAFTQVPAIQGEYRLVVVNSSETDITITMPTEENYQCLCGATLTIPAQTNIELIINVTDTLIYIRKG